MSLSLLPSLHPPLGRYYNPGQGYSPAAAGPVGGWGNTPGPGFFGKQSMDSLLPKNSFGKVGKRSFGYPLLDNPNSEINMQMFPQVPVGPGTTPGGDGGVPLQGMPSFQQYWGFGKKRKAPKSRKTRKNRKTRKTRKTRKSKKTRKSRKTRKSKKSRKSRK
jgi:hypothetical protein